MKQVFALVLVVLIGIVSSSSSNVVPATTYPSGLPTYTGLPEGHGVSHIYNELIEHLEKIKTSDIVQQYQRLTEHAKNYSETNSTHFLWKVLTLHRAMRPRKIMNEYLIFYCKRKSNTPKISFSFLEDQLKKINIACKKGNITKNIRDFSRDILRAAKKFPLYYSLNLAMDDPFMTWIINNTTNASDVDWDFNRQSTIEEYLDLRNSKHFSYFEKIERETNRNYKDVKDTWWTKGHYYQYDKEQWLLYTFEEMNSSTSFMYDFHCNMTNLDGIAIDMLSITFEDFLKQEQQRQRDILIKKMQESYENGYKNKLIAKSVFSNPFDLKDLHEFLKNKSDSFLDFSMDLLCYNLSSQLKSFELIDSMEEEKVLTNYTIIHVFLCVFSLVGNAFVIASVTAMKKITKRAVIKLSLAITDLTTVIAIIAVSILESIVLYNYSQFGGDGLYYNEYSKDDVFPGYLKSCSKSEREFDSNYQNTFDPSSTNKTSYYFPWQRYCVRKEYQDAVTVLTNGILNATTSVSLCNITLMALLKLYSIAFPMRYRLLTRKTVAIVTVIGAWIVPITLITLVNYFLDNSNEHRALLERQLNPIIGFIIPCIMTIISYTLLLICYVIFMRKRRALTNNTHSVSSDSKKVFKTISLILLGYTVTYAPFVFFYQSFVNIPSQPTYGSVYNASLKYGGRYFFTILYLNTIVDVFVYGVFDLEFRKFIKDSFIRNK